MHLSGATVVKEFVVFVRSLVPRNIRYLRRSLMDVGAKKMNRLEPFGMLRVLTAITLAVPAPPLVGQLAPNDRLAHAYVSALSGVMEEFAAESEVDVLFGLYHTDVTYEHPRIGVRIGERAMLRQGVISFLGKTRNPVIEELERTVGEGVVILRLRIRFDTLSSDGWQPAERVQVTILEITDGLISRIIDYW